MNTEDLNMIMELCREQIRVKDINNIKVQRLGGLTNKNFKVETDMGDYVVRLAGDGTKEMINREEEHICTELANQIKIDSQLIYFDDVTGIKICRYIQDAETMNSNLVLEKDNLKAIAEVLKTLHTCGKTIPVVFDVFDKIEEYENLLKKHSEDYFWEDYQTIKKQVYMLKNEVKEMNIETTMCHNDPLCENFIRGGDKMYLVDWEYAGMNDPMWDLADFFIEAELSPTEESKFCKYYFGHAANSKMKRRILINKIFLDFLWSLWGKLRLAIGDDLLDYANQRYKRAKDNLDILNEGLANVI